MRVPASQVYEVMPVKGVTFRKQVKVRQIVLQSIDIQSLLQLPTPLPQHQPASMTASCWIVFAAMSPDS